MARLIKHVIVTGGAQGIGLGIADYFFAEGYCVTIADQDLEAGRESASRFSADDDRFLFVLTDVSDETSVIKCVDESFERFGRIDVLINNAGIANPLRKTISEQTFEEWNRIISVNLTGAFLMSKYCSSHIETSKGCIINISSTRALQSEANTEAYAASKGGLVALTHALAVSFSGSIRVNCISPGWIEVCDWQKARNRMAPEHSHADIYQHPAGRIGVPEDIAALAFFLSSERAGFITGQNFVVDGGMTRKMIYS